MEASLSPKGLVARANAFNRDKGRAVQRLLCALEMGVVDPDAVPLLSLLNSLEDYYTTSSCSGRIQVAASHLPGEKFRMIVVAKWHQPISPEELTEVVEASGYEDIWLAVQGPIFHVACRRLESALKLLATARKAGFKHSGIIWVGDRIVVEIVSADRVETPLKLSGVQVVSEDALDEFVARANAVLKRAKKRLVKLESAVEEVLVRQALDEIPLSRAKDEKGNA